MKNKKKTIAILAITVIILLIFACIFRNCLSCSSNTDNITEEDYTKKLANSIISESTLLAKQYDYDGAMEHIKQTPDFENNTNAKNLYSQWKTTKENLVEYPHDKITHVFVHSLIYDPKLAFDDDSKADGYNLVMTTCNEWAEIMKEMYQKGYVLVSLHDICTFDENGNRIDHQIMLPEGKKPFVLSIDDVSYYHSYSGDGIADKLVIDDNGKVKAHYTDENGKESVGDFDCMPMTDTFVEKHPDFSYHGHKGTIALTGYNGVLGYYTDEVYKTKNKDELDTDQADYLNKHPDFNYENEVKQAKEVAEGLKEQGWEFASHTWGHMNPAGEDISEIKTDNEKWQKRVASIVGKTDIFIFPNGTDIAGVEEYTESNEKAQYFISEGFHIFCPVDSAQYWMQKGKNYLRQGRRNLDGYRMYHEPELLEDLFDVNKVFDKERPTPVPGMDVFGE